MVAKAYKAECTPEFYLFDNNRKLVYRGRMDESSPNSTTLPSGKDLRDAIENLLNDREIRLVGSQSHYDEERKRWYVLFLFETPEPLTQDEMKNPCEGIDELLYLDLEVANSENSTQGLKDIREAMKVPGKTYI